MLQLPFPLTARIRRGQAYLDGLIYGMIAERRKDPRDRGDLLSMLLAAVDTEEGTGGMTDKQVRDECLTVMLAGHETSANALSFALWEGKPKILRCRSGFTRNVARCWGNACRPRRITASSVMPHRYLRRRFASTPRCG